MTHRHPLPRIWLMTDARITDLATTIAALPRSSGIIFRHYHLAPGPRRALFKAVAAIARRRRHLLILADRPIRARQWGAAGAHDRSRRVSQGIRTVAVHSVAERIAAQRAGANLIFVSPIFPTQSHEGARTLGPERLGFIAGPMRSRTIALGGMSALTMRRLAALKLHGWAGIDALAR